MPGLNAISALLSAVETVERSMVDGTYVRRAVQENTDKIVELNVEQLYEYGINSLGISIDTYAPYSPYTIRVKNEKGQPTDRVTLRDTGDFHKSFEVVVGPVDFYITATDYKTDMLVERYGEKIFGLIPQNKIELAQKYLYPTVMTEINKELFS